MRQKVRQYLILNLVCYFGFLTICVIIKPHFWFAANEGGISNFGLYRSTVISYSLALSLSSLLINRAAAALPKKASVLKMALNILAALILLTLLDTYFYKQNETLKNIHIINGIILALYQLALSTWLTLKATKDIIIKWLFTGHLLGFTLITLTYFRMIHLLFTAQMIISLMFSLILIRGVGKIASQQGK